MATFLRDQRIANVTIDEDAVRRLDSVLQARVAAHLPGVQFGQGQLDMQKASLSYVIRFDSKGYQVQNLDRLLEYFRSAKTIERIACTVDTEQSRANRETGSVLGVSLDIFDFNRCFITVTSEDSDWVDASISSLQEVIGKCRNRNGWVRTAWMQLTIQLLGVALGFILSLWAASKIAPRLAVENPFIVAVLFVLLMFSNVWAFVNQRILLFVNNLFPSIQFLRPMKDRLHWLWQTIIGTSLIALALYIIGWIAKGIGAILSGFLRP